MKKSKNMKIMAIIFAAAVIAATMLFSSCGSGGKTVGQGSTSFKLEITKADGTTTKYTVKTDDITVGDALVSANLTPADSKTSGLINTLDGITLDYNADQTWWGFYVDGTMTDNGAFATNIESGKTYSFKVESPTVGTGDTAANPSDTVESGAAPAVN